GRWRAEMSPADELGHYPAAGVTSISYTPGKHGYAFLVDSGHTVTIDDADMLWPANSFTLEAWGKTTGAGVVMQNDQCGMACPSGVSTAYWGVSVGAGGHPAFGIRTNVSQTIVDVIDTTHDVTDNAWHHLVGLRDSTSAMIAIYTDGTLGVST